MAPRFFLPLLARLAFVVAGPSAVALWLAGALVAVGVAVLLLTVELWRIDRAVRTAVDDVVTFVPTPPSDLSWLDEEAIRETLASLAHVGFVPVADCAFRVPGSAPGFMRLLVHRHQRMYARVAQTRRGTHSPERVSITLFSALADGRTLTTATVAPHPTMAFGLTRNDSWQIRPGGQVQDLMVEHLTTRAHLCSCPASDIAGDGTLAAYEDAQTALYLRQAQECRTNGALSGIVRGLRWERSGNRTWRGGRLTSPAPIVRPTAPGHTAPAGQTGPPAVAGEREATAASTGAAHPGAQNAQRPTRSNDRRRAQARRPAQAPADDSHVSTT